MKKLRLLALMAMIVVALAVFTGCDKLKTEDVEADPEKYVMDGAKLTLSETPFAPVVETQDKIAYEIKMKGQGNTAELGLFLDTEAKKGSLDYSAEVDYGDGYTEETGIALFYEDKKVVIKGDMLEDILETDAVGVDLGLTYKDIEKSGIYELLDSNGVITDEVNGVIKKLTGKDGLSDAFAELKDSIEKLSAEQYEYSAVEEDTLTVGEKEVKVIVVTAKLNEDAASELIDGIADSVKDIAKKAGADVTDEDFKEYVDSVKGSLPETEGEYKFYLSKKTGALVKLESETESKTYDEYTDDTTKNKVSFEMTFGEDPVKLFLPSFSYSQKETGDSVKLTLKIEAESRIEDGMLVMEGKGVSEFNDEESETELYLEFNKNGEFTLTGEDDDGEEYSLEGEIESDDKGLTVTLDLSDAYGEDAVAAVEKIEFSVTFGEEVPDLPKYKDILDFSMDDITAIMQNLYGSYVPDTGYDDEVIMQVPDEETIRYYLDNYEMMGYESVDDVIDLLRDIYGEDLEIPEEYLED